MKFLICSDIHGSSFYAEKIIEIFKRESADLLIILGDIYNHGPRNPLPKDYAPLKVAELLNSLTDKLLVIKGNCDSEVDKMISKFDFFENSILSENGKKIFLTHGHVYNKDNKPKTEFDAVIYGHFHFGFIEKKDETVFANVGSVSLPKNGSENSYMIFENGRLLLKNLQGSLISEMDL